MNFSKIKKFGSKAKSCWNEIKDIPYPKSPMAKIPELSQKVVEIRDEAFYYELASRCSGFANDYLEQLSKVFKDYISQLKQKTTDKKLVKDFYKKHSTLSMDAYSKSMENTVAMLKMKWRLRAVKCNADNFEEIYEPAIKAAYKAAREIYEDRNKIFNAFTRFKDLVNELSRDISDSSLSITDDAAKFSEEMVATYAECYKECMAMANSDLPNCMF